MPRKVFTAGEVLAAADVNDFLMDQTIQVFAGTAARGSAIGTATEGMYAHLNDTDTLTYFDGSAWEPVLGGAWTAYTPTLTGFTAGSGGTILARYGKIGKVVSGFVKVTLGTAFTLTGIEISLPVAKQSASTYVLQNWSLSGVGAGDWPAIPINYSIDSVGCFAMNAASTYVNPAVFSTTVPFTWKATDVISVAFSYECA